jgi:hypothetical protein
VDRFEFRRHRADGRPQAFGQTDGPQDGTFNLAAAGSAIDLDPGNSDVTQGATASPNGQPVRQIVFIEGDVPDAQLLAAGVAPGARAVILDASLDGMQQIAAYLASNDISNLAAIDIVAHGQDGQIALGSGVLSASTIGHYQSELTTIGAALQPGGDIQIYGCDVAQGSAGVSFLDQLSAATGGSNVAASSHLVGAAADGGSWTLDVNVGNAAVVAPFTASAEAAYPDVLPTTDNQLFDVLNAYDGNLSGTGVEEFGVSGGAIAGGSSKDVIDDNDSALGPNDDELYGLAVDAPLGKYFLTIYDPSVNQIDYGTLGTGDPSPLYSQASNSGNDYYQIDGLALNQPAGELYFADSEALYNASNNTLTPISGQSGIYKISVNAGAGAPTVVVSGALFPQDLVLDVPDNAVFFTDASSGLSNSLDVGSLSGSTAVVLNSELGSTVPGLLSGYGSLLSGVAVNTATKTLYFTAYDDSLSNDNTTTADSFIDSIQYTGSGSSITLITSSLETLYSGANAGRPQSITIDPQDGIFYVTDEATQVIEKGSLSATNTSDLTTIYTDPAIPAGEPDSQPTGLVLLSTPVVTASGTLLYSEGAAATAIGATSTVSNSDDQGLASATVVITNGTASDTLSATTAGTSITANYVATTGTLSLTGADTLADYQTVLDSVKFSSTGRLGTRTIDWTVNDGVVTSPTATSTVDIVAPATVVAGATATFTGGGSAVRLDSALTVADAGSATLASATVVIGGFQTGDTLTVGTPGGLTAGFSSGTLTLSGVASIATYQTALESVAYSTDPTNTDPTGGGSHTSRTISWSVDDGTISSTPVNSTLNEDHVAGSVTASGTVTYTGAAVTLDAGVSVADTDSGGDLTGATVVISNDQAGDTLRFGNQNGITGAVIGGTLTLTGAATLANYQAALEAVKYATGSAVESVRTIDWTINDGASTSGVSTSSVDVICFCVGTLIGTPAGPVAVEQLKIGDMVVTAHNGAREVKWIGKGTVLATRGKRSAATPVIVRRGALADNVPTHDLHVTKAHSLYIDDVLIPAEFLVNYRTILWDDRAQEVEIYHVELDSHDVLLANGAPAESFRDDGNRWLFQNGCSAWDLPPQAPCVPVLTGGPVVDAVWRRLLDRAGPSKLPRLTDDPDLHLIVDGSRVDPLYQRGSLYGFRLPSCPQSLVVASRTVVPATLGIVRDPRLLGVALRQVTVRQGAKFMLFDADDQRLTVGFHDYEPADRLRWTDGYAELPAEAFARFGRGAELMLRLGGATQYPDCRDRAEQEAA